MVSDAKKYSKRFKIDVLVKLNKLLESPELDIRKNIEAVTSLPIIWLDISVPVLERASEYEYVFPELTMFT